MTPLLDPICPCCGEIQHSYEQKSCLAHRPPIQLAECTNLVCDLYMVTLTVGQHEKLTEAQIKGYAKVNRRQKQVVESVGG